MILSDDNSRNNLTNANWISFERLIKCQRETVAREKDSFASSFAFILANTTRQSPWFTFFSFSFLPRTHFCLRQRTVRCTTELRMSSRSDRIGLSTSRRKSLIYYHQFSVIYFFLYEKHLLVLHWKTKYLKIKKYLFSVYRYYNNIFTYANIRIFLRWEKFQIKYIFF